MSTTIFPGYLGVFGDQVYSSTDLNRRAGEVLDNARNGPVTISRNKEQFALLRREQVAELVMATLRFGPTLELIEGALSAAEGREPPAQLRWMKAFDEDDIRRMLHEVLEASMAALRETGDWEAVNVVIHQWRESGLVALTGGLAEAIASPAEESPLTDPKSILKAESDIGDTPSEAR